LGSGIGFASPSPFGQWLKQIDEWPLATLAVLRKISDQSEESHPSERRSEVVLNPIFAETDMPRIPRLRVLIESEPHSGRRNMAIDETLLETAISANTATLRWYQWSEPTVSLGYFQKNAELTNDTVLSRLPVVRRLSGGGAILHDDELTYCVALPATQTLFGQPHELYDIVHMAVAEGLRHLGYPVSFRGSTLKVPNEPLLCFQRQDEHDLTLFGKKVLGSAQRRRRGAIMQHGSLIRRASASAKQLPGLADLCPIIIPEDLAEILAIDVARSLANSWTFEDLTVQEIEQVEKLSQQMDSNVHDR
jgi:lipoate-protein ligase A